MSRLFVTLCFPIILLPGCLQQDSSSSLPSHDGHILPLDWEGHLSKTVTVEGFPSNRKLGAVVDGERGTVWIADFERWPEEIDTKEGADTRVRVTGTLIKRDDMPVFLVDPDDPAIPAGIPVPSEEALESAKWRYLLSEVTWTVLNK